MVKITLLLCLITFANKTAALSDCFALMSTPLAIHWFRRDLRIDDNTALHQALQSGQPVLGLFIFDSTILHKLEDRDDARVSFIHLHVSRLKQAFESLGGSMLVLHGDPLELWPQLLNDYPISAVYTNRDYEPYARQRDGALNKLFESKGVAFQHFKDQVLLEAKEVLKDDGKPYTVFTPYSRKWKVRLLPADLEARNSGAAFSPQNLYATQPLPLPTLADMGFEPTKIAFPQEEVGDALIKVYDEQRNFPGIRGTSRLGVHLRFGTISIRALARRAQALNETFLNELIWRDFYHMILWHFPHAATGSFKPAYDNIPWRNNEAEFQKWCAGQTGYPIVDAGMRELNATGFMHNRVRMIVASFLTKHLLIDWRWGEAYFARKLLDFDLAANNGGWQWAAGSGCDAAPYFRVFNPEEQTKKFDPKGSYIRQWVPEFQSLNYRPMVDHKMARQRALDTYGKALKGELA